MPWLQLLMDSSADAAERLAEAMSAAGAAAVTLQDSADQPLYEPPPGATPLWRATRVVGLFDADEEGEAVLARLRGALDGAPLPPWRWELLEDREWSRVWEERFAPMRFGERLWIVPGAHTPPVADAVNIRLDPGLAFGTGTHPTTRLCLEWLDRHPPAGLQVIDYGCGSGILALAAARLGALSVAAVDNDPQALIATRENARRNEVASLVHPFPPESLPEVPADLLLANILAGPLISLAPRLTRLVRPGGRLLLSGILEPQADAVESAYSDSFHFTPAACQEGWVRLVGKRRTD